MKPLPIFVGLILAFALPSAAQDDIDDNSASDEAGVDPSEIPAPDTGPTFTPLEDDPEDSGGAADSPPDTEPEIGEAIDDETVLTETAPSDSGEDATEETGFFSAAQNPVGPGGGQVFTQSRHDWDSSGEWDDMARDRLERGQKGLTVSTGVSYLWDSNVTLSRDGLREPGSAIRWDAALGFLGYKESGDGLVYGGNYRFSHFLYESSALQGNSDPYDHAADVHVGYEGEETTVRLTGFFNEDNGNVSDLSRLRTDERQSESRNFHLSLTANQKIRYGALGGGIRYTNRNFDTPGLSDSEVWNWDAHWSFRASDLDRIRVSLGVRGGMDESKDQSETSYWGPSLKASYRTTDKTSLFGFVAGEFRSYEGEDAIPDREDLSYGLGATWTPVPTSTFQISLLRSTELSTSQASQGFDRDRLRLSYSQGLPWRLYFVSHFGYERSNYFSTVEGENSAGSSDYYNIGANLGRSFRGWGASRLSIGLFYDYGNDEGFGTFSEFDRHTAGIRAGLSF